MKQAGHYVMSINGCCEVRCWREGHVESGRKSVNLGAKRLALTGRVNGNHRG